MLAETDGLTEQRFNEISDLVRSLCGINLHEGKKELVQARLGKRLRALGLTDYKDYVELGESGARDKGRLRIEGKEYVMRDGDVCHFRIGV